MNRLFEENPFGAPDPDFRPPVAEQPAPRRKPRRGPSRSALLMGAFVGGFLLLGGRMAMVAWPEDGAAQASPAATGSGGGGASVLAQAAARDELLPRLRADLQDRAGRILATSLPIYDIYADRARILDPTETATRLAEAAKTDPIALQQRLTQSPRGTITIMRSATPAQLQQIHDMGLPGVYGAGRLTRFYPEGRLAAHILGGVNAEQRGVSGVEAGLDAYIRDPAQVDKPIPLSIDVRVQAGLESALREARARFAAYGAAGVIMDARTGEIIAMASIPDFDPNHRPSPLALKPDEDSALDPLFDRAAQGSYEMGSVFKIFTAAAALESGMVDLSTILDARNPIYRAGHRITDYRGPNRMVTLTEGVMFSSNLALGRLATLIGHEHMSEFLRKLGFYERVPLQYPQGVLAMPQTPRNWGPLELITVGYGHGISVSPLHVAAATATLVNGGCRVRATLVRLDAPPPCERVVNPEVSVAARGLMRLVVQYTTGRNAEVKGYEMGGKTGTALKAVKGGYSQRERIANFLTIFPAHEPKYVAIVSLDDPKVIEGKERNLSPTAGRTAAPAMKDVIERVAPLLGLAPDVAGEWKAEQIVGARFGGLKYRP
ncbi:peptidoglycan D,D-transpeptidase FtsI family protein [Neomegalonema perideroedes]|uniref:peptidoglycan D,D-transpeptidase FtsI family protein n=1 Tax=Neomegalonema perideroedes TaxID=217219 RepID=UPI0003724772|nr:penicillin-binding protein 2 [Neomegalonema perideroedes]